MEMIERLPGIEYEYQERWLVRTADGVQRVAWMITHYDDKERAQIDRATARWIGVAHPRMSSVLERTQLGDYLTFVVEDDRGPSLADAAGTLADIPIERERWVIAQFLAIIDALATLGTRLRGFVHGDLDAHQLFVDPTGHARLRAPIGLTANEPPIDRSGRMGAGQVFAPPYFMSPEHARGEPLTPASDVFSLASNIALALTGANAFEEADTESPMAILVRIITEPPAPTRTYAPGLDAVLARAFEKNPRDRFPTPAAFGAALHACVPDAAEYDAVISDRVAAWWATAPQAHGETPGLANMTCKKEWEQLTPTAVADVRHCSDCQQPVVRIRSIAEAAPLIGQCMSLQRR